MNVKHIWSVLCKESAINQDDNLVSMYGVLEELSVVLTPSQEIRSLPDQFGVPMNYEIVSLWIRSKEAQSASGEIEYTLLDPENKELLKNTQRMEIPITSRRFRSRMKIAGLPLSKQGDYTFQVKIKEEGKDSFHLAAELPLEVKINLDRESTNP